MVGYCLKRLTEYHKENFGRLIQMKQVIISPQFGYFNDFSTLRVKILLTSSELSSAELTATFAPSWWDSVRISGKRKTNGQPN